MVSVAIPFYNQERYVAETLTSVLNQQTNFDYEIVAGDDGSTDNSKDIFLDFQRRYPEKIRVIYNEKNLGLLPNVKGILDTCRGKYIALLGGDDLFLSSEKLQNQYDFLESNPDHGLVHSNYKILIQGNNKSWYEHPKISVKVGDVFSELIFGNFIMASTAFFRRDLYQAHADFETWHKLGFMMEDYPMWLEFSKVSRFGYIDKPLSIYRKMRGTISRPPNRNNQLKFWSSYYKIGHHFVEKYAIDGALREKFLSKYHLFHLEYAFSIRNKGMAIKPIEYFKKQNKMRGLISIYYLGIDSLIVWYFVKLSRRVMPFLRISEI